MATEVCTPTCSPPGLRLLHRAQWSHISSETSPRIHAVGFPDFSVGGPRGNLARPPATAGSGAWRSREAQPEQGRDAPRRAPRPGPGPGTDQALGAAVGAALAPVGAASGAALGAAPARRRRGSGKKYRPGLDGLRALAIAGVLLYHAGIRWMPAAMRIRDCRRQVDASAAPCIHRMPAW